MAEPQEQPQGVYEKGGSQLRISIDKLRKMAEKVAGQFPR